MKKLLKSALKNFKIGDSYSFGDVKVYPLFSKVKNSVKFVSSKEAFEKKLVEITEIDKGGSVPELKLKNLMKKKLFLWDGEELVGAKQNRVLNTSVLIKEQSENIIPVSCVEQNRWSYREKNFSKSEFSMPNRIRRNKMESVNKSLREKKGYRSDQGKVWEDVKELANAAKVSSETSAMNDVLKSKTTDMETYLSKLKRQKKQLGFIVCIGDEIVGMEYISRKKVFKELYDILQKSYISDILIKSKKKSGSVIKYTDPNEYLSELTDLKGESFKSVGLGNELRLENSQLTLSALIYKEQVISISAGMKY